MGAIMEFATEKQIESFLSTCHIEGQKNFLMAFKKKTWLKSALHPDNGTRENTLMRPVFCNLQETGHLISVEF